MALVYSVVEVGEDTLSTVLLGTDGTVAVAAVEEEVAEWRCTEQPDGWERSMGRSSKWHATDRADRNFHLDTGWSLEVIEPAIRPFGGCTAVAFPHIHTSSCSIPQASVDSLVLDVPPSLVSPGPWLLPSVASPQPWLPTWLGVLSPLLPRGVVARVPSEPFLLLDASARLPTVDGVLPLAAAGSDLVRVSELPLPCVRRLLVSFVSVLGSVVSVGP